MSLQQYDLSKIESCCDETPEFLIIYKSDKDKDPVKVCKYHYAKLPCFNDEKAILEKHIL